MSKKQTNSILSLAHSSSESGSDTIFCGYYADIPTLKKSEIGLLERVVEYTFAFETFVYSVSQSCINLHELRLIEQWKDEDSCWICTRRGFEVWLHYNRNPLSIRS